MPSLGADMEVGTVLQWLVKPGDAVKRGDIVAVVDTEKATIEVEIFQTGVIQKIVVPEGEKVPVGTLLAVLAADGEGCRCRSRGEAEARNAPPVVSRARSADSSLPAPRVVREARRRSLPRPSRAYLAAGDARCAGPQGRPRHRKGTGPDGAITKADVERAAKAPPTPAPAPPVAAPI